MQFHISEKPASNPWPATLAHLASLEFQIQDTEKDGMLKRWEFGRTLLKRRVKYKGRDVVPAELMKLTIKECGIGKSELNHRIQCAQRFITRKEMSDAIRHYPSWYRMTHEGLVEKKRTKPRAQVMHSLGWTFKRLKQEVGKALKQHATLTREQIKDIEELHQTITQLLNRVDRNDDAKVERQQQIS